jgi:hypothetical protein
VDEGRENAFNNKSIKGSTRHFIPSGHQKGEHRMNRLIERLKRIKAERHSLYDAIPVPAYHPNMERQIRQSMDVMNQLLAAPDRNQAIAALRETLRARSTY